MKIFIHSKSGPDNYWLLKSLIIMKLTFIIILLLNLQAVAGVFGQTRVTLNYKSTDFKKVLSAIEAQSSYHFVYSERKIPTDKKVDIDVQNTDVLQALNQILANTGFTFNELPNHLIVIVPVGKQVTALGVTGTVVDEQGQPLAGASVKIKGASTGTLTDANGNFTLEVPDKSILVISYIGFISKEVAASGSKMTVALTVNGTNLNEVVVVGYGTQKKINLTGSVATVGADKIENRPVVNLADALEGLIPNLNINLQGGQPGTSATFNIRGTQTITGGGTSSTSPLILVDGVSRDPNLIDPNDVESVTVLKDAASAAIYGGRAANGVILITTKTGKKGPVRVNYNGSYTSSIPTYVLQPVNSMQYITMFNAANATGQKSGGYTTTSFTAQDSTLAAAYFNNPAGNSPVYVDPSNPSRYRYVGNTDWSKVLYPGAVPEQQHNVSISGGEGNTTFNGNIGYFRQDGLEATANQVYQRYTPSFKMTSEVNKWLTVNGSLSMTHSGNNSPAITRISQGGSWLYSNIPPLMPVTHPDGNFAGQGNYTNPVAVNTLSGRDLDLKNDFFATGRVIITPVKHLSVDVDYTWNVFTESDKANLIPFNEYGAGGQFLDIYPWTNPSQVTENKNYNTYTALNAFATYENKFGNKHYFKALVGYNQEYTHNDAVNLVVHNLIDPNLPSLQLGNDTKPTLGENETTVGLAGAFSRLNYIYDNRYLLEINARYDLTSRFRPEDRTSFSPSVSAGWNISEESFMKNIKKTIDILKIRASYGQLPDQLTGGAYPYLGLQSVQIAGATANNYLMNNVPVTVVTAPSLVSSALTWQKVATKNIGLDFAILRERLSGSFDYFINDISNIVVKGTQLPAVLGVAAPQTNSAAVRSHGWELSLNWKDRALDNKLFYSATISLSNNSNSKVISYNGNPTNLLADYIPGQEIGNIYGFVNQGYYKTDAEAAAVNNSALAGYKWLAGDIKYADLNNDGKIDYGTRTLNNMGDQKLLGNTTPHYRFGLNFNLNYKGFDFATFVQGVLERKVYISDYTFYSFRDDEYSIPSTYSLDYWTPQNLNAYFPRMRFNGSGNQQTQDKYIQNAAYARIKQLTLGYTLPASVIRAAKLQRVRVYVTGENLFTITSLNHNYDPEFANSNTYPLLKSISFGLQVGL
jgi:TonB-linked SusC/RagA family outer membrane protein